MKTITSLVGCYSCCLLAVSSCSAQFFEDPKLEQFLGDLPSQQFRGPYIPEENVRLELVAYLKSRIALKEVGVAPEQFISSLICLRDEETIRNITPEEALQTYKNELMRCGSPVAIEAVVPIMFVEEPFRGGVAVDVPFVSDSHHVAGAWIPFMLKRTPGFSEQVYDWAIRYHHPPTPADWELMRQAMRAWWKDNEQHFHERNYQAVTPPKVELVEIAPPEPPADTPPEPPPNAPTTLPPSPAPVPTASAGGNAYGWLAFAVLAALGAFWSLKQRSST